METTVRFTSKDEPRRLARRLRVYVQRSLYRFAGRLTRVRLFVEDVNGPKGGVNKQCRLIAELPGLPDVVISETAETIKQSVVRATARARHVLSERAKRRQDRLQARVRYAEALN